MHVYAHPHVRRKHVAMHTRVQSRTLSSMRIYLHTSMFAREFTSVTLYVNTLMVAHAFTLVCARANAFACTQRNVCSHIYMRRIYQYHANVHTSTHELAHTSLRGCAHIHLCGHTPIYMPRNTNMCARSCKLRQAHAHTQLCAPASTAACVHRRMNSLQFARKHGCIGTLHVRTHAHVCVHTGMCVC